MLLAFALTVPMALTLAPAINNRVALASSVRTGHIQAMDPTVAAFMNDADISAVQIFSGALTLSLAGALFMRGDLSSPETTTAPSKGMEMKKYTVTVKRSMREKKLFEKKIAELSGQASVISQLAGSSSSLVSTLGTSAFPKAMSMFGGSAGSVPNDTKV